MSSSGRRAIIPITILHDSTRAGDVSAISQELAPTGAEVSVVDCAYVSTSATLCGAIGSVVTVASRSLGAHQIAILIGHFLATGRALVLVRSSSSDILPVIGSPNIVSCELGQVAATVAQAISATSGSLINDTADSIFVDIDPDESVAIVCAEIPLALRPFYGHPDHRDYLRYATFADIDALIQLMVWFAASKHRTVWAYTSNSLPENALDSHLMVVGGPAWNTMADVIYDQVQLPIRHIDGGDGNPDPIVDIATGERWAPEVGPNGDIRSDIGFVAQVPSPFHPLRIVTIFGGVLTHGVEAGVKLCTSEHVRQGNNRVIEPLRRQPNQGFCIVFRCRVVANSNLPPDLTKPGVTVAAYTFKDGVFSRVQVS